MRFGTIIILFSFLIASSCNSDKYGTKKKVGIINLYCTQQISVEEANALSTYLTYWQTDNFFLDKNQTYSMQLSKRTNVYVVKMNMDLASIQSQYKHELFGCLAGLISKSAFKGSDVEFHSCESSFETVSVSTQQDCK